MADIYKIQDREYFVNGNLVGNGQFMVIPSHSDTYVRIEATGEKPSQTILHPTLITTIGDGSGGFYTDLEDLMDRGLDGFLPIHGIQRASFLGGSVTTMTLGMDKENPNYVIGLNVGYSYGLELIDELTGTVKNTTGRTLNLAGTFSYNPDKGVGEVATFTILSELSIDDGTTWSVNRYSKRTIEVSNSGESFQTKVSSAVNLIPGALIRFRMYKTTGDVAFRISTDSIMGGQEIISPSVEWVIYEV